ncbi:MAG: serine protease [Hyphomicrobium sp.]
MTLFQRLKILTGTAALVLTPLGGLEPASPALGQETIKLGGRRIVGGEATDIARHPWQVALTIKWADQTMLCGGSIVAHKWVLTAAHCFPTTVKPGDVRAKSRVTNYVAEGAWANIDRVLVHKRYNADTHENDLALVKFRSAPPGRVIPLVTAAQAITVGQPLEVTGWGATGEGADASAILLKASVPYIDNAICNEKAAYDGAIQSGMMCAGYRDGGIDSCQGDSGGPLVWRHADGPILVGVVSWGDGCARKLKYGVYTRVAAYRDWISETIRANGN